MASKASTTAKILADSGIRSPARPWGYPDPSKRSWWNRITSTASPRNRIGATIPAPTVGWVRIFAHAEGLRGPGFVRIRSGIPTFADVVQTEPVDQVPLGEVGVDGPDLGQPESRGPVEVTSRSRVLDLHQVGQGLHGGDARSVELLQRPVQVEGPAALLPVEVPEVLGEAHELGPRRCQLAPESNVAAGGLLPHRKLPPPGLTASRSSSGENGLRRYASAPAALPSRSSPGSDRPLTMTTRGGSGPSLSRRQSSWPERPGISTSTRTTSGVVRAAASSAALPSSASEISQPSNRSRVASSSRIAGSSSTINTRIGPSMVVWGGHDGTGRPLPVKDPGQVSSGRRPELRAKPTLHVLLEGVVSPHDRAPGVRDGTLFFLEASQGVLQVPVGQRVQVGEVGVGDQALDPPPGQRNFVCGERHHRSLSPGRPPGLLGQDVPEPLHDGCA